MHPWHFFKVQFKCYFISHLFIFLSLFFWSVLNVISTWLHIFFKSEKRFRWILHLFTDLKTKIMLFSVHNAFFNLVHETENSLSYPWGVKFCMVNEHCRLRVQSIPVICLSHTFSGPWNWINILNSLHVLWTFLIEIQPYKYLYCLPSHKRPKGLWNLWIAEAQRTNHYVFNGNTFLNIKKRRCLN